MTLDEEYDLLLKEARGIVLHQESVEKAEKSFYEFVRQSWHVIKGDDFYDGWHIGAMCEHAEALFRREILRLIINVPPRTTKSTVLSIMLPAWIWIHKPEEQFLYASHSRDLAHEHSILSRQLITSEWYQARWGYKFRLIDDQNTKGKFGNTRSGYRATTSVNSKISGTNASFLVGDDMNDRDIITSKASRDRANSWDSTGFLRRKNDPKTSVVLKVQQRLHQDDNTGYTLANDIDGEYVKLILPMEFEVSRKCSTIILPSTNGNIWTDPREKEGDLLWPERIGPKELAREKIELISAYNIAGQFQQRPAPAEGGIIKKDWFQWWKQDIYPTFTEVIQSWDTAFTDNKKGSYSACTTWGIFHDSHRVPNLMLIGMWRDHVLYPDLRKIAQKLARDYRYKGRSDEFIENHSFKPDLVLVEAKASGQSLIPDLRQAGISAVGFNPSKYGDKDGRVQIASNHIECGRVWLPTLGPTYTQLKPFADTFLEECAVFPNGSSRDIVDSMTQVLIRVKEAGYIQNPSDPDDYETPQPPKFLY